MKPYQTVLSVLGVTFGLAACSTTNIPMQRGQAANPYALTNMNDPCSSRLLTQVDKTECVQNPLMFDPARVGVAPPQTIRYTGNEQPGTILINSDARALYLIEHGGTARRYQVAVGKDGHALQAGEQFIIGAKETWAIYAGNRSQGINGVLGSRLLYLWPKKSNNFYGIHGTNNPSLIGDAVSNGCIRMHNIDAIDLTNRIEIGAVVKFIAGDVNAPTMAP